MKLVFVFVVVCHYQVPPVVLCMSRGPSIIKSQFSDSFIPAAMQVITYDILELRNLKPAPSTEGAPPAMLPNTETLITSVQSELGEETTFSPGEILALFEIEMELQLPSREPIDFLEKPPPLQFRPGTEDNLILRIRRPLTKYVRTLLDLHTILNLEAKKVGFSKYQGFSDKVIHLLEKTSQMSAADQLKTILEAMLENDTFHRKDTPIAIATVIQQLSTKSDLYRAMEIIKTLHYQYFNRE